MMDDKLLVQRANGPGVVKLMMRVPMPEKFSINNKFGVNTHAGSGQRMYINADYASEEKSLCKNLMLLIAKIQWQVAPTDRYLIVYNPVFPIPKTKRQRTGDIHNPLKPFSDVLKKAAAIWDDDNTWQEVATKHQMAGDPSLFWMTVSIYRFPDSIGYRPIDIESLIDQSLQVA